MLCFKRNICLKMFIQLKLIVILLIIYQKLYVNCFLADQNYFNLNRIDSHRSADRINFLKQEIQIPDGVSEVFVSEIKQILNYYENPLVKLGHELIGCDGSNSQYERCLKTYNQFENIETSLHSALIGLKQQFVRSAKLDLKQSKKLFNFGIPKIVDRVYNITKDYALRIKLNFSVMKMNETTGPTVGANLPPNTGPITSTETITTSRPNAEKITPNISHIFVWLNGNINGIGGPTGNGNSNDSGNGNDESSDSGSGDNLSNNSDDDDDDNNNNNDDSDNDDSDADGNDGSNGNSETNSGANKSSEASP